MILILLSFVAFVQADTHFYRYSLETRTGAFRFAGELNGSLAGVWDYYSVERDGQGRVAKVSYTKNGVTGSTLVYLYEGDSRGFIRVESFVDGKPKGYSVLTRNNEGLPTRIDNFNNEKVLESYSTTEFLADHNDLHGYDPTGKETFHNWALFDGNDIFIERRSFLQGNKDFTEMDTFYSSVTGYNSSTQQLKPNGSVSIRSEFIYDADGRLTRREGYAGNGTHIATVVYENELRKRRTYYFPNGGVAQEFAYAYDKDENLLSTSVYYGGKLICSITFERSSSGKVVRAIAKGTDGAIWAEYRNHIIWDLNQDGTLLANSPTDTTIYRQGNWW